MCNCNGIVTNSIGANGLNGGYGGYSSKWFFNSGTASGAPSGHFRLNSTNPATATKIYISHGNAEGITGIGMVPFLDTFDNSGYYGSIKIFKEFSTKDFAMFDILNVVDNGAYHILDVIYIQHDFPTGIANDETFVISFSARGKDGINGLNGKDYIATSLDSLNLSTILNTTITAVISIDKAYTVGARVRFSSPSFPTTKFFEGVVLSYNILTGAISIAVDFVKGIGVISAWNVNLTGEPAVISQSQIDAIIPIGTIKDYVSSIPPLNYLNCDGSLVSKTTYSALYAVVGANRFGVDTATDFFLPDLRSRVSVGFNSSASNLPASSPTPLQNNTGAIGNTGGLQNNILSTSQLPPHKHNVNTTLSENGSVTLAMNAVPPHTHGTGFTVIGDNNAGTNFNALNDGVTGNSVGLGGGHTPTGSISGTTGDGSLNSLASNAIENRQSYIVLNKIIKAL